MPQFDFNISLSVLNHLGRNLYRNFSTILGEAISNSWDADAQNVWITLDRENNWFSIKDDGNGMSEDDFRNKFLKVGHSKRTGGVHRSQSGRPFIGRKGIGKLALLSCSEKIYIVTKATDEPMVGGIIDNPSLDRDIDDERGTYTLSDITGTIHISALKDQSKGTFLFFENLKDSIKNTPEYMRTIIAMYFRFSTIDPTFHIHVNGQEVTVNDLQGLVDNTQFLWVINGLNTDPLLNKIREKIKLPERAATLMLNDENASINGFIATVDKPSNLTIRNIYESVTLDLFVNGRLREKDIMKHIKTQRIAENYLYGQINYNSLDSSDDDPFTSSRESVKDDDPKVKDFFIKLKEFILRQVIEPWDAMREEIGKDGDIDNQRLSPKARKGRELFNASKNEYIDGIDTNDPLQDEVDAWMKKLGEEAQFNFPAYADCFLSENLTRKYIQHKGFEIPNDKHNIAENFKEGETNAKNTCGMNIDIRQTSTDLYYLDMGELSSIAEPGMAAAPIALQNKAKEFKPIRNAVMHTSLITTEAKTKLTSILHEVRARIRHLLKVG